MKNTVVSTLLKETGLSPESLADLMGIAGMTIRRWLLKPEGHDIGNSYDLLLKTAMEKLITDGRLMMNSESATWLFENAETLSFDVALKRLGAESSLLMPSNDKLDQVPKILELIGAKPSAITEVEARKEELSNFSRTNTDWLDRIMTLLNVIRDPSLGAMRAVAFGALFYLLAPLDLIPDAVPAVGFLDDFGMLGVATSYYLRRKHTISPSDSLPSDLRDKGARFVG